MLGRRPFHTFEERKFLARVFKDDFEKNDLTKDDLFLKFFKSKNCFLKDSISR